jgi:glutamyl-tRNA synthetase
VRFDARLVQPDEKAQRLLAEDPGKFRDILGAVLDRLRALGPADWLPERLEIELRAVADARGAAAGVVFQPVRVALTGSTVSEPVNLLLEVVGREESLKRLSAAREWGRS